jgi:hypothetical protein
VRPTGSQLSYERGQLDELMHGDDFRTSSGASALKGVVSRFLSGQLASCWPADAMEPALLSVGARVESNGGTVIVSEVSLRGMEPLSAAARMAECFGKWAGGSYSLTAPKQPAILDSYDATENFVISLRGSPSCNPQ